MLKGTEDVNKYKRRQARSKSDVMDQRPTVDQTPPTTPRVRRLTTIADNHYNFGVISTNDLRTFCPSVPACLRHYRHFSSSLRSLRQP